LKTRIKTLALPLGLAALHLKRASKKKYCQLSSSTGVLISP